MSCKYSKFLYVCVDGNKSFVVKIISFLPIIDFHKRCCDRRLLRHGLYSTLQSSLPAFLYLNLNLKAKMFLS